MPRWTLDDIDWDRFDDAKVDPDMLKLAKAASLVEYNSGHYADYLESVFHDDPEFKEAARVWAEEEVQHGLALAKWASLADPSFDFDTSLERFREKIKLPVGTQKSIRGSRARELVARCVVEIGTSSYYRALTESVEEPVLKEICQQIAQDEVRHYKLFYTNMCRYEEHEQIGKWGRLLTAAQRFYESEDDELAYAYYAANHYEEMPYDRRMFNREHARRGYAVYQYDQVQRAISMALNAVGLPHKGRLHKGLSAAAYRFMRWRVRTLERKAANSNEPSSTPARAA